MENDMSAKTKLQALEGELRQRGVVDVKFFFSKGPNTSLSEVASDVADVLEAALAGKYKTFDGVGDIARA